MEKEKEDKNKQWWGWDEKATVNPFDVIAKAWNIEHSLKEEVTSDWVLAKLNNKESEFAQEYFMNGDFVKKVIEKGIERGHRYKWNKELKDWEKNDDGSFKKFPLEDNEKRRIKENAEEVFRTYIKRILLMITLARNRENNFLIKLIVPSAREEEEKEVEVPKKNMIDKIKDLVSGGSEEDESD